MTMHHGEEIQQRDLPCDFLSLKVSLYQMNIVRSPSEVSVQDVQAEFTSDDPLGQKLIGLIHPGDLLTDVDVAAHQIKAAPQPVRSTLGKMLMDGRFETIGDIQSSRDRLLEEMCGARQFYYFPLSCSMEDEDGELYESDAVALVPYSEQIQDAIEQDQARDIDTMAMHFWCTDPKTSEAIKNKLLTIRWGVEEIHGQLYGRVEVTSTAPLTAREDAAMKEWISGQNSDGLGEGFEQRPIETDYGDIYVHFWNSGDDYFIQNEEYGKDSIDFNKIIPMPESLNIRSGSMTRRGLEAYQGFIEVYTLAGTRTGLDLLNIPKASEDAFLKMRPDIKPEDWALGRAAFQNIQQYGAPTWYEWCIQNWGTKWNAYDCDAESDENTITFQTAWSAPHPILQKLSEMYPDLVMEHQWADEDIGANCGQRTYQGGDILDEYHPDYGKLSVEFACQVMGAEPEDYGLVLSRDGTEYVCAEDTEETEGGMHL